jgi:LexA-binding, inner membrane-associated putative hydrolase
LFLLGHSCWSYLISKLTGRQIQVNLPAWLAFLSGILPDFDIYFRPILAHHTWTHSILILLPISLILAIRFGRLGIAFSTGILSHLLTDSLVGTIPILYPFSSITIGLNLGIPSVADTILETGALLAVLVLAYTNNDYLQITRPNKKSLWLIVPLYALITLSVLFAGDNGISLASFAFSRKAFTLITIGHAILAGLLALGVVQGARAVVSDMRHPNSPSTPSQIPTTKP